MKTKTIGIGAALVVAVILLTQFATFAQDLPVYSQDVLRNSALTNVVRGTRFVNSQSMDWDYSDRLTSTNASGKGAENVLDKLFAVELKYRLTNPEDKIQGWVYLYDKFDTLLFFGYAEYTAASLKAAKPTYGLWMQNIPVGENLQSAEVLALDEDGKTARHHAIEVDSYGRALWQPWLSGAPNGILVTKSKDGTLTTYDLGKGAATLPGSTAETAKYKIEGHHILDGLQYSSDDLLTLKIIETYQRPTALLRIPRAQFIIIDVLGIVQDGVTSFERPYAMEVTNESGVSVILMYPNEPIKVTFPPGNHRVRFLWKKFGKPGLIYTGPEYGDGKG